MEPESSFAEVVELAPAQNAMSNIMPTLAVKTAKKSSEELMYEWMEKDPENRKCSCPIEKNKGCMHMACPCGVHICWQCMKYFKSPVKCYDHIEFCQLSSCIHSVLINL